MNLTLKLVSTRYIYIFLLLHVITSKTMRLDDIIRKLDMDITYNTIA
jgi:hypothetical protein